MRRDGDILRRSYSDVVTEVRRREKILAVTAISTVHYTDARDCASALELVAGPGAAGLLAACSVERVADGCRIKASFDAVISAGATDVQLLSLVRRAIDICASTVTEHDQRIAEIVAERRDGTERGTGTEE
ncbi:hypothetical protein DDD63_08935 [Actinobaculum sp. 313]|nr:hypothetical protein DDD63_08935 [Actinobaculum sp. 313]